MTTIAFDGKVVACDTQVSIGDRVQCYRSKIHKINNGSLVFAGSVEDGFMAIDWLNGKMDIKPDIKDFHGILILNNGDVYELFDKLVRMPISVPWASGSGSEYAFSAMKLGLNAVEAVNFAMSIDLFSGGEVESIEIHKQLSGS